MLFADLFAWWGLSLTQTLLVLALIFLLVDIFFQSDIPTHLAYILAAIAVVTSSWISGIPVLLRVLAGLVAWALLVFIHYTFWREFMVHFVNVVIAPTKYKGGVEALIGEVGIIKEIGSKKMVSVHGDLWPIESELDVSAAERVRIVGEDDGLLRISKIEKEE